MLQLAQVTPADYVVDLGSGDGKIVIAAVREFDARGLGLEYNPEMVGLSRRNAARAGIADRALFRQADIFETDFSAASVVTMYLLPGAESSASQDLDGDEARHAARLAPMDNGQLGCGRPPGSAPARSMPGSCRPMPAAAGSCPTRKAARR